MIFKLKFVFGIIPVPIFYTNFTFSNKTTIAGTARGPVILIKPNYIDDVGLLQHELNHVKQFWFPVLLSVIPFIAVLFIEETFNSLYLLIIYVGTLIHSLLYRFASKYRLWSEVQSYRIQANYYANKLEKIKKFAIFISTKYQLKISVEEALILLLK